MKRASAFGRVRSSSATTTGPFVSRLAVIRPARGTWARPSSRGGERLQRCELHCISPRPLPDSILVRPSSRPFFVRSCAHKKRRCGRSEPQCPFNVTDISTLRDATCASKRVRASCDRRDRLLAICDLIARAKKARYEEEGDSRFR